MQLSHAKGYQGFYAVGSDPDGRQRKGEMRVTGGELNGGGAMAGDDQSSSELGENSTQATVN